MDTINIVKQKGRTSFLREMNSLLWLLFPGGKSCFDQLQSGGSLLTSENESEFRTAFEFNRKGRAVHCSIDPDHDYLPRRVVIGGADETVVFVAREFKKFGGHWFPAAGFVMNDPKMATDRSTGFRVVKLKLNEPVDTATFEMPKVIPRLDHEDLRPEHPSSYSRSPFTSRSLRPDTEAVPCGESSSDEERSR